jgi:hypothetical protein
MKDLSEGRTENMTGNAVRQKRYQEKMRAKGLKKLTLWVTPEQEREICFLLQKQEEKI